jgi:hypothetical protein
MVNPARHVFRACRWLRTMAAMLRELRTNEQRILSVRDQIVRELRRNLHACKDFHESARRPTIDVVQRGISVEAWHQYRTEGSILRKRNIGVWNEVSDVYDQFERTLATGKTPPLPAAVAALADRLERADL